MGFAVLVAFAAFAFGAAPALADLPFGPSLTSDQADYMQGSPVVLSGGGWQFGEAVHIDVTSTDPGLAWSTSGDVTAAADGTITYSFTLPDAFAAQYTATATGQFGETATVTFTDAPTVFAFTQPTEGAILTSNSVVIRGSGPATAGPVSIVINGGAPQSVTPSSGSWSLAVTLADGNYTVTATQGTTSFTHHFEVDTTPPTAQCTPSAADGAWHATNVVYNCTASDNVSGVSNGTSFTLQTSVPPGSASSNAATDTHTVRDNAGHLTVVGPITGNMIDRAAPTFDCHGATSDGLWHADNVSFQCDVSDQGSGATVSSVQASTNVPDGSETASAAATATACDNVGNCNSVNIAGNRIDRAAPVVSCSPPDQTIWYAGHVQVTCTSTDGGSGLQTSADSTFTLQASTPDQTDTTNAFTPSYTVFDRVGHGTTVGPFGPFMLDNNAPFATPRCNGAVCDGQKWYGLNTGVTFLLDDGSGSGPMGVYYTLDGTVPSPSNGTLWKLGDPPIMVNQTTTLLFRAVDNVGNIAGSSSNPPSQLIQIDGTPPTITLDHYTGANRFGWDNQAVTVVWRCDDSQSGPQNQFVSATVFTEGQNQSASGTCFDQAGNSASATFTGINIDETAPTITYNGQNPAANANGWNNTNVTLTWTCSDALSGPQAPGDSTMLVNDGFQRPATGNCVDLAGNHASDTEFVNIDQTVPITTFVGRSPAPNANGWNNTPVTLTWSCSDPVSGPVSATITQTVSTEGAHQTAVGTCVDLAGNTNPDSRDSINIDLTKPTIAPHADVIVNATAPNGATVTYTLPTATDNLTATPAVSCAPASGTVFAIGDTKVTCTAMDLAGNVSAPTSFNVHVKGAVEQIGDLAKKVAGYVGLTPTQQQSVYSFVTSALTAYNLGMPAHKATVCSALSGFIAAVQLLEKVGALPLAVGNDWIADATRIRAVLAC